MRTAAGPGPRRALHAGPRPRGEGAAGIIHLGHLQLIALLDGVPEVMEELAATASGTEPPPREASRRTVVAAPGEREGPTSSAPPDVAVAADVVAETAAAMDVLAVKVALVRTASGTAPPPREASRRTVVAARGVARGPTSSGPPDDAVGAGVVEETVIEIAMAVPAEAGTGTVDVQVATERAETVDVQAAIEGAVGR